MSSKQKRLSDEEEEIINDGLAFAAKQNILRKLQAENGWKIIDLLETILPIINRGMPIPEDLRPFLVKYLEEQLAVEIADNRTDRESMYAARALSRQDAMQVFLTKALGNRQVDMLKKLYERQKVKEPGLTFDTYKKRIHRLKK